MSKSAIVTGAANGIGLAIARSLVDAGYRVGVLDLHDDAVRCAATRIEGAVPLACDVTDEDAVERAFDHFGEIPSLVVNNAAVNCSGSLIDQSVADFERVLKVNLVGAYIVTRAAVRRMLPTARGHVISITSTNAYSPGVGGGAYPSSKAGLLQLSKQFALEYGEQGLRFNSIAPGFIDAGMSAPIYADMRVRESRTQGIPLRRLGLAQDIANAVLMLDSDHASYISGVDLLVDGALTHAVLKNLPRF